MRICSLLERGVAVCFVGQEHVSQSAAFISTHVTPSKSNVRATLQQLLARL